MQHTKNSALLCAVAGCAVALVPNAAAAPQELYWTERPNTLPGYTTWDLSASLEPNDTLNTLTFNQVSGITPLFLIGGGFYDENGGSVEATEQDNAWFSANSGNSVSSTYRADSGVAIGDKPLEFIDDVNRIVWDPAGVTGTFFTPGEQFQAGPEGGDVFIMRMTFENSVTDIGGQIFLGGANGSGGDYGGSIPSTGIFDLPFSLGGEPIFRPGGDHLPPPAPTPGALGVFAVAGAFGARRRR